MFWFQLLNYGSIGVGLSIAILAAKLFHAQNIIGGTRLMWFGLALVIVGAGLEILRAWQSYDTNQRLIAATANLPESFFDDFLNFRTEKAVHLATATDEYFKDTLEEGQSATIKVRLDKNECKYFFAAAKPPARVQVAVKDLAIDESNVGYNAYYEVGLLCNKKEPEKDFDVELSLKGSGGQSRIGMYKAPPIIDVEKAAPKIANNDPKVPVDKKGDSNIPLATKHTVCTGEYEENCAGPHDIFRACGQTDSQQIAAGLCTSKRNTILVRSIKSGNHCGYSLFDVLCD